MISALDGARMEQYCKESVMAFEPKIEGVRSSSLSEYEDEHGKCYIGGVGGMPEREHAFYYADSKYEFCFYASRSWDGNEFDVEVKDATIYRFHGASPHIDPRDFDRISRNMAKFFAGRWFWPPQTQFLREKGFAA